MKAELFKNTLIIAFGKLSTQFLTFLLLPLYTAYLATNEFGTVDLIMTYVTLLAPVVTISLEMAAFRFLIDARNNEDEKRRVISNTLQMVGTFALLFVLCFTILDRIVSIPYGWLVIGTVLAVIFSNLFLQFARGFGDNVKFSIGGVIAGVTTIAANIVLIVQMGMGASGMLWALLLGNVACAIYLIYALKLYRYARLTDGDMGFKRKLVGYSAPLVPNGVAWWAINAVDRTIVAILLGVASNGIYAVAYKFPLIFSGLFSFFGMSWTEAASVHIDSKDRDNFFSQSINASIRLFGSLGLCIIAGIPLIFDLMVNSSYREAYLYIPVLMIGALFNSVVVLYSGIYIAKKMTTKVLNSSLFAAAISIGLTLGLTPFIGLYAPALAVLVAYLAMAVYRYYDIKKIVAIRYDVQSFALLIIAYSVVIGFYYLDSPLFNIANIVLAGLLTLLFNRKFISSAKTKIFSRLRPLTPDQQLAEEVDERK
jgi:O-antigen/teichoic acid export membrane protein